MAEPIRVSLSELKVNPVGYLESARSRRVLLTRRGRVVGELLPIDEADPRMVKPLLGCATDLIDPPGDVDLTAPVEADWEALS